MLKNKKILVFHIGHLGDTIISLPAIIALKNNFPNAEFWLLTDKVNYEGFVSSYSVYENTNYFNNVIYFQKSRRFSILHKISMIIKIFQLRHYKFDSVVYLVPSLRRQKQVKRDFYYFSLCGIKKKIGFRWFLQKNDSRAIHESDKLLQRLEMDNLNVPEIGHANFDLKISTGERKYVKTFFEKLGDKHIGKKVLGIGPGAKMQSKQWPLNRFIALIKKLIINYDIWPIFLGGLEDSEKGNILIKECGRGYNATGALTVRQSAAALECCDLYIGNDTGTMHLAAAVGTPCVAIFSARDEYGKWHPYGNDHIIFRSDIECSNCKLEYCSQKTCINSIQINDVYQIVIEKLNKI